MNIADFIKKGGQGIGTYTFYFLQATFREAIDGIVGGLSMLLNNSQFTNNQTYVLSGCVITNTGGSNYSVTTGWVLLEGEVMYVPAHTFTGTLLFNTQVNVDLITDYLPERNYPPADTFGGAVEPTAFQGAPSAPSQNIHQRRYATFSMSTSAPNPITLGGTLTLIDAKLMFYYACYDVINLNFNSFFNNIFPSAFAAQNSAWVALTLASGWSNYTGVWFNGVSGPAGYKINSWGDVRLRGAITGAITGGFITIATLPSGARPANNVILPIITDTPSLTNIPFVTILTTGNITLFTGGPVSGSYNLTLDGLTFNIRP